MSENPVPVASHTKLRWYQFSLRTLLIFVTLVVAFFCWFGYKLRLAREQRAAVLEIQKHDTGQWLSFVFYDDHPKMPAWVEKLAGKDFCYSVLGVGLNKPDEKLFAALDRIPNFQRLVISDGKVSPEDFEHIVGNKALKRLVLMNVDFPFENLGKLESLEELYLEGNNLKDDQMRFIDGLRNLRELKITSDSISDQGMAAVKQLPSLKFFEITSKTILGNGLGFLDSGRNLEAATLSDIRNFDQALEHLRDAKQLEWLKLQGPGTLTDRGMSCLEDHPQLASVFVRLPNATITGKGLRYLEASKSLKELSLGDQTTIADDDLAALEDCKPLEYLQIVNSKIRGPGLKHLAASEKLRSLQLPGSDFDDEGIAFLNQLPASSICIGGNNITDAGVEQLRTADIETLLLEKTGITDKCLEHLAQIRGLERLRLGETAVTFEGLKQFSGAAKLNLNIHDTPAAKYLKDNPSERNALQSLMPGVEIDVKP